MKIPETFRVLVITLSDRAAVGEYSDLSGPAIASRVGARVKETGWEPVVETRLIADDRNALNRLLSEASREYNLIITSGGTGIGPRDITVDTVKPLLKLEIPGIMEMIRVKSAADKPSALLSRGVAGIIGNALIFTLPGSVRAVNEYLDIILPLLHHTVCMQYGVDIHDAPGGNGKG
ncbi:MAG: MogA/MoaB family molybdenum cofactor biosynthesis protein [Bacteroidetes bacterium]|nr:MogA/MoaB family molybdenum cofactor biosynthesis protein [Bacteroidota bacterium]